MVLSTKGMVPRTDPLLSASSALVRQNLCQYTRAVPAPAQASTIIQHVQDQYKMSGRKQIGKRAVRVQSVGERHLIYPRPRPRGTAALPRPPCKSAPVSST
eukprot:2094232-Rhodomonas_salina.1